uniref:Uncharacterized protein n=1 Tax=Ditylenchus dipsaci TaxID=166011 RepID=A0A915DGK9_9BILA
MVREERELWLQCLDWLVSTGILEHIAQESRLVKPADLAAILRDGVLLCELVLKLCPGCIDRQDVFLLNRKSPFMCSKNISLFLNACQQHFGLTELFNYNDLYDLEDFERVLKVLSNLSHSQRAKQFNLRPFPILSHASTSNGNCSQGENTIYCNLREEVEELASSAEEMQYDMITNFQGAERDKKREELYDSILTQRTPKIKVVSSKYAEYKPTNERSFVPKNCWTRKATTAKCIFALQVEFCAYGTYCSLLKSSQAKLEELERTKPETKKIINDMSNVTNKRQFKLQDLLVVPMQRLLKYSLLLKILMKNTSDIAEHSKLDSALEAMNDINNYVNEMKRDHEAIEVIHRLHNSVVMMDGTPPGPFSDYGRLLEDGVVKLSDFEEGMRAKQRYVFLFEKLLMICKQQKTGIYEFRRSYFFTEFELVEGEPEVSSKTSTLSRKLTASFFDNTVITLVRKGYRGDNSTASSSNFSSSLSSRETSGKKKSRMLLRSTTLPWLWQKGILFSTSCNKDMCRKCCGLQNCTIRLGTLNRAKMNSMSSIHEVQFRRGDLVVSRQSINSMDTSRLSCNSGDLIEVPSKQFTWKDWSNTDGLCGKTSDTLRKFSMEIIKCNEDKNLEVSQQPWFSESWAENKPTNVGKHRQWHFYCPT